MGAEVSGGEWSNEDKQRYREKVRQDLDVFARMLSRESPITFESDVPTTGMEMELYLVDDEMQPSFTNAQVLETIGGDAFTSELARFNVELNVRPRLLEGRAALDLEDELRAALNEAHAQAGQAGAHMVQIGTLPTLMREHFDGEWMSDMTRYAALESAILRARGENMHIDITGPDGESISMYLDTIAPESACTSVQLHLQVAPHKFGSVWNAAQILAGPQVALGANSPFFAGKALWHETRIPLFQQATDTRSEELSNQGVRPRVTFGDRWITSVFDLFEDNVRYYPALLPELTDEDPVAVLEAGQAPELGELRLHNGTIYRWNRPIYDTRDGRPHLRVENRVLPAGPTVADAMANAAFYYGVLAVLATADRPLWSQMTFDAAEHNFLEAARHGMHAMFYWPGLRTVSARELTLRRLLPMAEEGLASYGVDREVRDRYLGIIEGRCESGQNGAIWQLNAVAALEEKGLTRAEALTSMTRRYTEHMHSNEPVHLWPLL